MGAGASNFEPSAQLPTSTRYLCHECNSVCFENEIIDSGEKLCPTCRSTFVEEIHVIGRPGGRESGGDALASDFGTFGGGVSSIMGLHDLSAEQSRRLANATLMLRLLDAHLRQELDMFQRQYQAGLHEQQEQGGRGVVDGGIEIQRRKMSGVMRDRLRFTTVTMDMICSLPSCPICCEVGTICLYTCIFIF